MKRFVFAAVVIGVVGFQAGHVDAAFKIKKGTVGVAPSLGVGIGVADLSVTMFKIGSDLDYMFSEVLGFCGTLNFGLASGTFDLEVAPGIKFRIASLYKHNVDLGIKGQLYFDYMRFSGANGWGFGAKFGPSFRYFFTDTIGAGLDFNFKIGATKLGDEVCTPAIPAFGIPAQCSGGAGFGMSIDLMFGATFLF